MLHVCLAVRPGAGDANEVAAAVLSHRPDVRLTSVWGGDPHLRPPAPARTVWADLDLEEPCGLGWELLLVASSTQRLALAKACRVVATSEGPWCVLSVGDVAVLSDVAAAIPERGVALVRRAPPPIVPDGLSPSVAEYRTLGGMGVGVLAGGDASVGWVARLADLLTLVDPSTPAGHVVELAASDAAEADGAVGAAGATFAAGFEVYDGAPALVDTSGLDHREPWHLACSNAARAPLSAQPEVAAALERVNHQWAGTDEPVRLPGGLEIDAAIRSLALDAIDDWRGAGRTLPPSPFSDAAAFRRWLEAPSRAWGPDLGRYWTRWHELRPDLQAVFPRPESVDHRALVTWIERRWWSERMSPLIRSGYGALRAPWTDGGHEPGINLVGYHSYDKSIGDVARRIAGALDAAGTPYAALDYHRSGSPRTADPPPTTDVVSYDTNLCIVNADSFPHLMVDYGDVLRPGRRTIGYWFWEVQEVPPSMLPAIDLVDEIWAGSEFVADAFRAVTSKPVRTVPIPVPPPEVTPATRADLGMPDDRFVFLVTFDYLSIAERKNPVGAIDAFRRAFPEPAPDGPVLVVKSLNAHVRPHAHELTRLARAGRDDVVLIDRHVTRGVQMAMIEAADCLVSLHRSEGLGLHLMEAMWLGTPTIATRYSGNLLFSTDANSCLIDAGLTEVVGGEGYLPTGAEWADPDLDQAAEAMRRMLSDEPWRSSLAQAGRATMEHQTTLVETGHLIAGLCGVPATIDS